MKHTPAYWIKNLSLEAHPEGGYFAEVFRSAIVFSSNGLPERYSSNRNLMTSIYFMLEQGNHSAFHRLQSDENWYFHDGAGIYIYCLTVGGELNTLKLGLDPGNGFYPHVTIPAKTWFAAELADEGTFSLVSCAVSPGFEYQDFELAEKQKLVKKYPRHKDLISRLSVEG